MRAARLVRRAPRGAWGRARRARTAMTPASDPIDSETAREVPRSMIIRHPGHRFVSSIATSSLLRGIAPCALNVANSPSSARQQCGGSSCSGVTRLQDRVALLADARQLGGGQCRDRRAQVAQREQQRRLASAIGGRRDSRLRLQRAEADEIRLQAFPREPLRVKHFDGLHVEMHRLRARHAPQLFPRFVLRFLLRRVPHARPRLVALAVERLLLQRLEQDAIGVTQVG
mmetsp:Transcript_71761/g.196583  ORF Transcript_71761/g.196583 Transcript_71761/m.196583 type:complete len:229 (+) Transcript_71761:133-819(+)